jgi:hypothetical protein
MGAFFQRVADTPAWRRAAWVLLAWALATAHQVSSDHFLYWDRFLNFQGEHPYQTRILPIWLAKGVFALVPYSYARLMGVFWVLDFAAMLVAIAGIWRLGQSGRALRPLLVLSLWTWQMAVTFIASQVHNWYYPYDFLAQAFMAWGCWLIVSGRSFQSLAVLTLVATLNRETAIWLPVWYLAWHGVSDRKVLTRAGMLFLACLSIKLGLAWALNGLDKMAVAELPGHHWRLTYNFAFLWSPQTHWQLGNVLLAFGGVWVLLWRPGRLEPALRRMVWCLLPATLLLAVVGNLAEVRVFAEFFPVMALAAALKVSGCVM